MLNKYLPFLVMGLIAVSLSATARSYQTVRTYECPEAIQGVAVDTRHFYAIANQEIARYDRKTGEKTASWKEENKELIRHFDGGVVIGRRLYCSHSNYPEVPMASSIEVFNTRKMTHVKTISLGIENGSCTWVVKGKRCWYVGFAHYDNNGGEQLKDASWTQVVQYDRRWRRVRGWILPKNLLEQLRPNSISGCLFINGRFYCTGHDATKLFVLEFPPYGMRLVLADEIDIPFHGQGIAMDSEGALWGIDRKARTVMRAVCK